MTAPDVDAIDAIDAIITSRRTCLRVDADEPVDPAIINQLCRLATWAPNHQRTQPWRFAVFTGDGRRVLGDTIATAMAAEGRAPEKVAKTRLKYLRAPAMLVIGAAAGASDLQTTENRDAVAASVQNVLLAATARGLGSFWSSVATPTSTELLELCGFEEGTTVVAAVYLGHPTGSCAPPGRDAPRVTWVG